MTTATAPLDHLRKLTGDPGATFREHQQEAILDLVDDRARVLCVQRTGWGKSAVYFVATALLRERGAGPTLIVSPLLALMRNQLAAAERLVPQPARGKVARERLGAELRMPARSGEPPYVGDAADVVRGQ